jgi:hypothetical protein
MIHAHSKAERETCYLRDKVGGKPSTVTGSKRPSDYSQCRLANARPEPNFRYRSKRSATASSENAMVTGARHGRRGAVWGHRPAL